MGPARLTEFDVEAAPASDPKKTTPVKFVEPPPISTSPNAPQLDLRRQERTPPRHSAPSSSPSTAKTKPPGALMPGPAPKPAAQSRLSSPSKPISNAGGTVLTFHLQQNHGGWNSDDNQNNNLGRFRLSITTAPGRRGRSSARQRPRDPRIPAAQRTRSQQADCLQLLAHHCARVEGDNDKHRGALARASRRRNSQLVADGPRRPRGKPTSSRAAIF